jgi:hypothetical protein
MTFSCNPSFITFPSHGEVSAQGNVERKHVHARLSDEAKIMSLQEATDQGLVLIPGDAQHTVHPLGLSRTGCQAEVRVRPLAKVVGRSEGIGPCNPGLSPRNAAALALTRPASVLRLTLLYTRQSSRGSAQPGCCCVINPRQARFKEVTIRSMTQIPGRGARTPPRP